jgi:hypothetical protein
MTPSVALSFLAPWSGALAGIILFAIGPASTELQAGSGFKDIAYFEEGTAATLAIVVEYKPDGLRSINVRFNRPPNGGSLFFHDEEWKAFSNNLSRVKGGPDRMEQTFADLDAPGGSLLRMSAARRGNDVSLTLINQPHRGDSHPPVPFHLSPADFDNLLKAVVDAAKATVIVNASSATEFARFRTEIAARFTPAQLQDFDTGIQELQLDARHRGMATEAAREADLLGTINRKTFPDAVLLGWRARKARLIREIPEALRLVNQDTADAAKTVAPGTPESVAHRLASEKEALAKLRHDRDDTLRHLNELTEPIGRPTRRSGGGAS